MHPLPSVGVVAQTRPSRHGKHEVAVAAGHVGDAIDHRTSAHFRGRVTVSASRQRWHPGSSLTPAEQCLHAHRRTLTRCTSIRCLEGVSTGVGANHTIELLVTKRVRKQLGNQTTAMIKWNVSTVRFPIASVRRLTIRCNKVVSEEE